MSILQKNKLQPGEARSFPNYALRGAGSGLDLRSSRSQQEAPVSGKQEA